MPPTPHVLLEIDDNSAPDDPAFTSDPSVWSFAGDYSLHTRTAAEVFRALHQFVQGSVFRGYPPNASDETRRELRGDDVTWVTAAEIAEDRPWLPTGDMNVERTLQLIFDTVDAAARRFGADRVRLVFGF